MTLALAFMAVPGSFARAQVPSQDLPLVKERQNDLQRRLQEDKLREDEQLRRAPVDRAPDGMVTPRAEPPAIMADGECRDIASIVIDGAVILSAIEAAAITRPFEGQCLGLAEIDEILRHLTNWYMDRGFVTTRAYLPQQDLSGGALTVLVMEGKAEAVRLKDDTDPRHELSTAFPGVDGKTLNISDLEQGLDQINRVPSVQAKMDLVPGQEPGGSVVEITRETGKWWRASLSMDNAGSTSTGRITRTLGLELDSPLARTAY